jgi:hypothetical protein
LRNWRLLKKDSAPWRGLLKTTIKRQGLETEAIKPSGIVSMPRVEEKREELLETYEDVRREMTKELTRTTDE